ncbi:MAG: hypothetical protein EOO40_00930 [Deltaproteobacteria bacterium]|nr:MAG: hypothetical protein EOO40_00930 [Deltaproteobacteria bacterium]
MSTLRDLQVHVGFSVDANPLEKLEHQVESLKTRLNFLSGVEVLKGLLELADRFSSVGEAIETAAVQAGISSEAYQQMAFAASQAAIGQEELSGSLGKLARNIADARDGSKEAKEAFARVGIGPEQVAGFHNASDAMLVLSDHISQIQDPIKRTQALMSLLGRGSANMAKFLGHGSKEIAADMARADAMGAVISNENIEQLAKLEDSLSAFGLIIKSTFASFAAEVGPVIRTLVKNLGELWAANRKVVEVNFHKWVITLASALGYLYGLFHGLISAAFEFADAHSTITAAVVKFLTVLGSIGIVLEGVEKAFGPVKFLFNFFVSTLQTLSSIIGTPFKILITVLQLSRAGLASLMLRMALLTETVLPGLSAAFLSMGAAIQATPIGWLAAGIAAIVVASHDLWTLWNGGKFEDTWIGKAILAIKGLSVGVLRKLGLMETEDEADARIRREGKAPDDPSKLLPRYYDTKAVTGEMSGKVQDFGAMVGQPPPMGLQNISHTQSRYVTDNRQVQVDAPITINAPAGVDTQTIGKMAADSIDAHFNDRLRDADISSRSPVQY